MKKGGTTLWRPLIPDGIKGRFFICGDAVVVT